MIVDMHAHALGERFLHDLSSSPRAGLSTEKNDKGEIVLRRDGICVGKSLDRHLYDLDVRLESLRRRGITRQLFGPPPGLLAAPGYAIGVERARALHLQQDEIVVQSDGLMEAVAVPPLGEADKVCDELQRAMDDHGYRAAMIPTTAGGRPLDDPAFEPFFALAEARGLTLIMHPTSGTPADPFGLYVMQVLLGWPAETTLAVARLIFAGIFERHPGLKLVLVHGGGNLVFQKGRLDSAFEASGWEADPYFTRNIDKPPSEYLKRLYYDTCTLSVDSNDFIIRTMGVDNIVFGSDYPFDIGDPEGRRSVPVIDALPSESRDKVYSRNAAALLAKGVDGH